jgi:hypothetical protein
MTDKSLWKAFLVSKGAQILYSWCAGFGLSNDVNITVILKALKYMPFDIHVFNTMPFPKYLKKITKQSSKANQDLANSILNEWKRVAEKEMNKEESLKRPKKDIMSSAPIKKQKQEEKKPAVVAVSSFDIFKKLSEPAKGKQPESSVSLKRKLSDPLPLSTLLPFRNNSDSAATTVDTTQRKFAGPIVNSPIEERISISEKTGKPKKSVRFLPESEMRKIVLFNMEDAPAVVVCSF